MDQDENTAPEESAGAETDSKDDRVFSPLVTAQERKRMILERRRKEREAAEKIKTSDLLLKRTASDSSSSMSSRKRTRAAGNIAAEHSQSDTSVSLSKDENESQESQVEGTRSMFSFIRRRHEPGRALMNPFANDSKTPRAKGSSASLFGAVMKRASLTPVPSATPTKTTGLNLAAAGSFTPGEEGSGSQSRLRWDASATPTSNSSNSRSRSMAAFQSPGGFGLQKILDSVTSPFHLKHIHRKTGEGDDSSAASASEEEKEAQNVNEWYHASLDVATGSLDVLDWTMKRKLRIECHPSHCLPGSIALSDGSDKNPSSPEGKWEEACMYWHHPATEGLPPHLKEVTEDPLSQSTKEVSASMLPSSSGASDMIHDVRGRHAFLSRFIRHAIDTEFWKERRLREWQEAFRSLYMRWINRLRELQNVRERGDVVSAKEMLDASFYLVGSGQMVLFRVSDREGILSPTVLLSSTSRQLRGKLRDMGASLYVYRTTEDNDELFDESVLEEVPEDKPEAGKEPDMVQEELEALRRAQAHGETAGADVSVSMRSKRSKERQSPRSIPPLCLHGEDDCTAFFELYLNTFGHCKGSWRTGSGDVPKLFTRGLGSFQHASLKTLRLTSRRYDAATPQQDGVHSFLELRGPILPSALQELIGAAASQLTSDVKEETKPSVTSEDEEIGSHYFVLQAVVDDGNASARLDDTTTGTSGSHLFNQGRLNTDSTYCQPEGGISMVVWDVARPDSVAFKVDASTLDGLLGT